MQNRWHIEPIATEQKPSLSLSFLRPIPEPRDHIVTTHTFINHDRNAAVLKLVVTVSCDALNKTLLMRKINVQYGLQYSREELNALLLKNDLNKVDLYDYVHGKIIDGSNDREASHLFHFLSTLSPFSTEMTKALDELLTPIEPTIKKVHFKI